jgi:hypothetical protein
MLPHNIRANRRFVMLKYNVNTYEPKWIISTVRSAGVMPLMRAA